MVCLKTITHITLVLKSHPLIFLVLFLWMHWFLFHNELSAINIIHFFIILNVNLQLFGSKNENHGECGKLTDFLYY
jgi:Ca2+/Na+ antiporter